MLKVNDDFECIDWEKGIKEQWEKIDKEVRETDNRVEKAAMKKASWDLFRVCRSYIQENSKSWKENKKERIFIEGRRKKDKVEESNLEEGRDE